jgi:hypothetical protein
MAIVRRLFVFQLIAFSFNHNYRYFGSKYILGVSPMTTSSLQKIDHSAMKASQITIVFLNIVAFVLNLPWLAAVVGIVMFIGVALKVPGFMFVYRYGLKPLGLLKPEVLDDNPEPHRFSQLLGGIFMAAGSTALFLGLPLLGWTLVWIVTGLAALNAFGGFCVGCAIYYWLARYSVPGFRKLPPPDTFPGMRPKGFVSHES